MIYHYTSVEALALILSRRAVRFTRLDYVDDLEESTAAIDLARFFYVSCWTRESDEDVVLWQMYTEQMRGVRIGLPYSPFERRSIDAVEASLFARRGLRESPDLTTPLVAGQSFKWDFYCPPTYVSEPDFFGPVNYVENPIERKMQLVGSLEASREKYTSGRIVAKREVPCVKHAEFVRTKAVQWSFQREHRFHLVASNSSERDDGRGFDHLRLIQSDGSALELNGQPTLQKFIDVEISAHAFDALEVTCGPLCSAGQEVCVAALLAQHAPSATLRQSALRGKLQSRGAAAGAA